MPTSRLLVVVFALLVAGCAYDRRKEIAFDLLFLPDGFENDAAFAAALGARFPPGTAVAQLEAFASAHGAQCQSRTPGRVVCELTPRAKLCQARLIKIEAPVDGDVIQSVTFLSGGLGC